MTQKQKENYIITRNSFGESASGTRSKSYGDYFKYLGLLNKVLCIAIVVVGISGVMCVNDLSIKGFTLKNLKVELTKIEKENKNLEITVVNLESLENVTKRAEKMKLVRVDNVEYISANKEVVARR